MKKTLLYLYILLPFVGFAQQNGSVVMDWNDNGLVTYDSYSIKVPQFRGESFYFDPLKKAIFFPRSLFLDFEINNV